MNPRCKGLWLFVIGASILVTACEEERDVATVPSDIVEMDADFIVFGGEQYITQEGRNQAHVLYDTAFQWVDSTAVALRGVELVVFNEDGSERGRVTSERGVLDQRTDRMIARGNVVLVVPDDGRTLRTEELHYDPERNRIFSDSAWVMELPDRRPLTGTSFESDLEFRRFEARGGGG